MVSESFPVSTNCTCVTCVQQIAFPLGLSDLERFNQRQLRYPTIVLLQLTLGSTAFEPTRYFSFLQDSFAFLRSNRSHNRATREGKSLPSDPIDPSCIFFLIKTHDPAQNHANSNIIYRFVPIPAEGKALLPIVFEGSIISSVPKTMEFSTDY